MFGVNAVTGRGYNPSVSFADSSPYTGEPRSALSSPCRVQGSRGGSAASRRVCLTEHRGAKNALHRLCAKFRIPNSAFRITLCRHPFKMCAHGAHTHLFFMRPKGALHLRSKKPAEAGFLLFTHISLQATMSIPVPRTSCRSTSPHLTGEVTLILFISSITSKIFSLGMSPLVLTGMRG